MYIFVNLIHSKIYRTLTLKRLKSDFFAIGGEKVCVLEYYEKFVIINCIIYSRTSRKRPPKMSSLGGHLREAVSHEN